MVQDKQGLTAFQVLRSAVWSFLSDDREDIGDLFRQELDQTCKQLASEMGLSERQAVELESSLAILGPGEAHKRYAGLLRGHGHIPFDAEVLIRLAENLADEQARLGRPDEGTGGTNQKKRPCPIRKLFEAEEIDTGHYRAAFQIERAWHFRTAGVAPKVSNYGDRISGGGSVEDETAYEIVLQETYSDWLDRLRENGIKESLVLDVIVHGYPFREADRMNKCRNGTARPAVIASLELYMAAKAKTNRWVASLVDRYRNGQLSTKYAVLTGGDN